MTQVNEIYKCPVCGNIVEMVHSGVGQLVCCGKPMELMKANTVDAAKEKHVPAVQKVDGGVKVTVGSVPHPMEDKHYIEWIELIADGRVMREHLKPGMKPEAFFPVNPNVFSVRELCNLHGLWKWNSHAMG